MVIHAFVHDDEDELKEAHQVLDLVNLDHDSLLATRIQKEQMDHHHEVNLVFYMVNFCLS